MCIYTYTVYMLIIRTSRTYVNQITLVETLAILGQLVACVVLMVPFWCGWNPQKASAWLKSSILLVTYNIYIYTFIYLLFRSKSICINYIYIYICLGIIFQIVGKFYLQFAHTCQQATMDKNWWISPSKMIQKGGRDCIDLDIQTILT